MKKALTPFQKDLQQRIWQSTGRASACWENLKGAGVFDEKQANETAGELYDWITLRMQPKPQTLWQRIKAQGEKMGGLIVFDIFMALLSGSLFYAAFFIIGINITFIQSLGIYLLIYAFEHSTKPK